MELGSPQQLKRYRDTATPHPASIYNKAPTRSLTSASDALWLGERLCLLSEVESASESQFMIVGVELRGSDLDSGPNG
jgi:hypothetical protein